MAEREQTVAEVAERLGVSPRVVHALIRRHWCGDFAEEEPRF